MGSVAATPFTVAAADADNSSPGAAKLCKTLMGVAFRDCVSTMVTFGVCSVASAE